MATAPRPGTTPGTKSEKARLLGFRITVRDEPAEIYVGDIGPRDDAMVRRETNRALGYKLSLMGTIQQLADGDTIGLDSLCLLWWFGRRKADLTGESFNAALDRFPNLGEVEDVCDIEVIEPDGEEDGGDPLPSAGD